MFLNHFLHHLSHDLLPSAYGEICDKEKLPDLLSSFSHPAQATHTISKLYINRGSFKWHI